MGSSFRTITRAKLNRAFVCTRFYFSTALRLRSARGLTVAWSLLVGISLFYLSIYFMLWLKALPLWNSLPPFLAFEKFWKAGLHIFFFLGFLLRGTPLARTPVSSSPIPPSLHCYFKTICISVGFFCFVFVCFLLLFLVLGAETSFQGSPGPGFGNWLHTLRFLFWPDLKDVWLPLPRDPV